MTFRVGLVGCGRISDIYIENCARFEGLDIVACASLDREQSQAKAVRHHIPRACSVEDILSDPDIDCVLNLTIPAAHADIALRAVQAGKHVYSEKPLVTDINDGKRLLAAARQAGVLVGNAPDTFLGGRWQTVRRLIDEGVIGRPTGVGAYVGTHGTERHNPNPDFYYQVGGGPLLDLGPYYLTAMVFCLGPIARVAGMASRAFDRRMIENGPRKGEWMQVEVDTHSLSLLEFEAGVIGSMMISFDVWDSETPRFRNLWRGGNHLHCRSGPGSWCERVWGRGSVPDARHLALDASSRARRGETHGRWRSASMGTMSTAADSVFLILPGR